MICELSKCLRKNIITEINEGFPNFFFFTIPLDLSYTNIISNEEKSKEINDLSDNINLNLLSDDLINISTISSDEDFSSKTNFIKNDELKDKIQTKKSSQSINGFNSFNQSKEKNNSFMEENQFLYKKEEEGKKVDKSKNVINYVNSHNFKDYSIQPIQNYNINIYNPHINCVNISYPTFSLGPCSSFSNKNIDNKIIDEKSLLLDEKDIINEKLPLNLYYKSNNNINNLVSNISFNNNDNNISFIVNNSFNKLGDNFPINYPKDEFEQNLIFNNNKKVTNNNIKKENEKNVTSPNLNGNQKTKKNKKKKKKKIEDEYTVEMFGRRGWICEGCNNFNYESRKNCNRCKIPKKPLKKAVIMDNKGNKIIDNLINANHKDDWNCYNCGNINYAFRLNCNRCQMKREKLEYNNNEIKGEN